MYTSLMRLSNSCHSYWKKSQRKLIYIVFIKKYAFNFFVLTCHIHLIKWKQCPEQFLSCGWLHADMLFLLARCHMFYVALIFRE